MELLSNAAAIVMVVLGLGFVIFIHELGHFLLAKWNGVKVEKFAIGFDIYGLKFYSKQVGETKYVIGALPLGGYVKMLGEEPGEASDPEAAADPRSYFNKPVGARMAIISAGVVMNLLFGFLCFTYIYLKGKPENPPVLGAVLAGQPAYEAGLRAGDRVLTVDDRPVRSYTDLQKATIFSDTGQVLRLEYQRPAEDAPARVEIRPRRSARGVAPAMGIYPAEDLLLIDERPYVAPAGADPAATPAIAAALKGGGTVAAAAPEGQPLRPLRSQWELERVLAEAPDKPLAIQVVRPKKDKPKADDPPSSVTLTLPPVRFVDFGMRMTLGPVVALRQDGPAAKADIRPGDRIVAIDGRNDFDPMRLPDLVAQAARENRAVRLEIERLIKSDWKRLKPIEVIPEVVPPWGETILPGEPLDLAGLGLAVTVVPLVARVAPNSPAARAGVKAGDRVEGLTLTVPTESTKAEDAKKTETVRFDLTDKSSRSTSWSSVFDMLQHYPLAPVALEIAGRKAALRVTPEPVADWYQPHRGLQYYVLIQPLPPQSLPSALRLALDETVENASAVYYIIRGLVRQRLGVGAVGGPVKIVDIARQMALIGFDAFISFLAMLSINLAVVNFLPIPPLDGGQMLFLIAEKIRGRPVPERLTTPLIIAGFAFIILIFVLVNLNDILSYFPR